MHKNSVVAAIEQNSLDIDLPSPSGNQAFCNVSALEAGHLDLLDEEIITGATPGKVTAVPSLSFLLRHSTDKQTLLFDLGIKKDWQTYPPTVVHWIHTAFHARVDQDVAESLSMGGLSPDDINYVCLSHCHWDHTGDTRPFKNSTFLVGEACQSLLTPGYPKDPKAEYLSDILPEGRTIFYSPSDWEPVGPFPRALDFFEDGSLYVIDAPGHLPGHINLLARTSPDGGWIYLAGDSAHHWSLLTLDSAIAGHSSDCAHEDKEAAQAHILRINALMRQHPRVRVLLAHDEPFYAKNKDGPAFWPGKIETL